MWARNNRIVFATFPFEEKSWKIRVSHLINQLLSIWSAIFYSEFSIRKRNRHFPITYFPIKSALSRSEQVVSISNITISDCFFTDNDKQLFDIFAYKVNCHWKWKWREALVILPEWLCRYIDIISWVVAL